MTVEEAKTTVPKPSRRATEMPGYQRSDLSVRPGVRMVQLSRNESALPMQPAWMEAAVRVAGAAAAYPDSECTALRLAIAETFHLDQAKIVCTAGLMEGLQSIALAYLNPEDNVVIPEHNFVFFRHVAQLAGARVRLVRERSLRVDIHSILDAVDGSTKMVILANPGNPTGTYLGKDRIRELRLHLPPSVLLVVDEAYAEFVGEDQYQPLFDFTDLGNVIVLRSFSKMYGLAGFRVAWAYCCEEVVESVRRIQAPAIVGSVAQAIAAAAVRDQETVQAFKQEMLGIRRRFTDQLKRLERITPVESQANFVLLRTQSEAEARQLDDFLRHRGIVLRRQMPVGLGDSLRATIGTEEQMQFVASSIIEWCDLQGS